MDYETIKKINIGILALLVVLEAVLIAMNNAIGVSLASIAFTMVLCIILGIIIGKEGIN